MKTHILISLVFCCFFSLAQEKTDSLTWKFQYKLIELALQESDRTSAIRPIDELLDSKRITVDDLESYLWEQKAKRLTDIYKLNEDFIEDELVRMKKISDVVESYNRSYALVTCLKQKLVQYERYLFLKEMAYEYNYKLDQGNTMLYQKDLRELKSLGYVPEKDGYGVGVFAMVGEDTWVGAEFSFFSSYEEHGRIKIKCNDSTFSHPIDAGIDILNGLTFSYARGLNSKTNDVSLSLLELHSPISIVLLKFGGQINDGSGKVGLYYRPTLGVGYGPLSLTYAYNLMFQKAMRAGAETHLFMLRFMLPITNHRYKVKTFGR